MDPKIFTKRLSNDTNYQRPKQTFTDTLSVNEIKEKLTGYKKVNDVREILIGSHVRYFVKTPDSPKPLFRLGGFLTKFGEDYKYVVLSNGKASWSVQVPTSTFWVKKTVKEMAQDQITESIKPNNDDDKKIEKLNKKLSKALDYIKEKEKETESLKEKLQNIQKATIEDSLKKKKDKK